MSAIPGISEDDIERFNYDQYLNASYLRRRGRRSLPVAMKELGPLLAAEDEGFLQGGTRVHLFSLSLLQ